MLVPEMKPFRMKRWFNGSFTCIKCKKLFSTMSFGFGEAICPECYKGEQPFLFFDESYLLNRIITRLQNHVCTGHVCEDRVSPALAANIAR